MIRVLEIGGHAAGYCGRLFAHAPAAASNLHEDAVQADVVHIDFAAGSLGGKSPAWASGEAMELFLHAGKRRVAVEHSQLLAKLAAKADVVICEGETAREVEALGFHAWTTPVKVAITPFGLDGPKCNWRATPNVLLAMGGYTQLMGDADQSPLTLPGHYLEFQTGALAYFAASACLFAGESNLIDLGQLETLMTMSQFTTVRWHCAGELRSRHGSDFWFVVPSNLFRCVDGWVYINIVPTFWDPLTVFLDRPELLVDERFINNDLRMQHRDELHAITAEAIGGLSKTQLVERAEQCRIPLGVVQTFEDVLADPHLAQRHFFERVQDGAGDQWWSPALPYRLSDELLIGDTLEKFVGNRSLRSGSVSGIVESTEGLSW